MRRLGRVAVALVVAAGCALETHDVAKQDPDTGTPEPPDAGCSTVPCGTTCCEQDQVCFEGSCCTPSCASKLCGSDGCGGDCGGCAPEETCDDNLGVCVCAESDEDFCRNHNAQCDVVVAVDTCGQERAVSCGTCKEPMTCDTATKQCVCVGEPEEALCSREDAECGAVSVIDQCGDVRTVNCGSCPEHTACDWGKCTCVPETYEELCAKWEATCGTLLVEDRCQKTRDVSCGGCGEEERCQGNRCVSRIPINDQCEGAEPLVFHADGRATASGELTFARHDVNAPGCGGTGADVVYRFTTTEPQTFDAVASYAIAGWASLHLRSEACEGPVYRCGEIQGGTVAVHVKRLPPGTWYLWVDATNSSPGPAGGAFTLEATLRPPPPLVDHDVCEDARQLTWLNEHGFLAVADTTEAATDGGTGSCAPMTGDDLVYFFTLPEDAGIRVLAKADTLKPSVYVRRECGDPDTEIGCGFHLSSAGGATVTAPYLPGGVPYYIIVDGVNYAYGSFVLEVETYPPVRNDVCETATVLPFPEPGTVELVIDTLLANDDSRGSCSSAGRDVVFALDLSSPKDLDIQIVPETSSQGQPTIYLRSDCSPTAQELGCATVEVIGRNPRLQLGEVPQGVWYLFVDSRGDDTHGRSTLTVRAEDPPPPPPYERCEGAEDLVFTGDKAVVSGSTAGLEDDYRGSCEEEGKQHDGGDRAYRLTLAQDAQVTLKLSRSTASPAYNPAVYLKATCESDFPTDELVCANHTNGTASVTALWARAGVWFVVVDGMGTVGGDFTLEVTLAPPVTGDTCLAPIPLTFDASGKATASGDNTFAKNDILGSCGSLSNNDIVYSFTLTAPRNVEVSAKPKSGSKLRTQLSVRSSCADPATELGCTQITGSSAAIVNLTWLPAGTYFVWVDGYSTYMGPYDLTVTATVPPPAPPNDTCEGAQVLTLDGAPVAGSTSLAADQDAGTCETAVYPLNGNDLVYRFELTQDTVLSITLARRGTASTLLPAFYLRRSCDDPSPRNELGCTMVASPSVTTVSRTLALEPGLYYLFVDGTRRTQGDFDLTISASPAPPGDVCTSALPLSFNPEGVATASGDNTAFTNDLSGRCLGTTTGDVVYTFTTTAPRRLEVDAAAAPGSTLSPVLYVRDGCAPDADEVGCVNVSGIEQPTNRLVINRLPAGVWYLFVDGNSVSKGAYDLSVKLSDPPSAPTHDTCAGAQPLTLEASGVPLVLTGTTENASDQYAGTCGTSSIQLNGNDLVYAFTLTKDAKVTAKLDQPQPAVYIRRRCDSARAVDEVACAMSATAATASINNVLLPAGSYYLFVDGVRQASGPFTLTLTVDESVAAGDTCVNAIPLQFDLDGRVQVSGTTAGVSADQMGSCFTTAVQPGAPEGTELVYSFSLRIPSDVSVVVTPTEGNYRPNVYLRTSCADASSELACVLAPAVNVPVTLTLPALPIGDYYLFLDSFAMSLSPLPGVFLDAGPFTLSVTATPMERAPNDTCDGAEPLVIDPSASRAVVYGDTTRALDDLQPSCARPGGRDVVYSLTLVSPLKLVARVDGDPSTPGFEPVVAVRSSCASSDVFGEVACGEAWFGMAQARVNSLPQGDYWVVVDSASGTPGRFRLAVALAPPVSGPPNEVCARAQPLAVGTTPVSASGSTVGAASDTTGSCAEVSTPDVVYSFTLQQPAGVEVSVTPSGAGYRPAVFVRSACGSVRASDERGCAAAPAGGVAAQLTIGYLPAGAYYLWVDGKGAGTEGDFTLEVKAIPPTLPPPNDTCASPEALLPGALQVGDTRTAVDDEGSLPAAACRAAGSTFAGRDLVYAYTPAVEDYFSVEVVPSGLWRPAVWIARGTCGALDADCRVAAVAAWPGYPVRAETMGAPGETYFVIVDGLEREDAGPFTIVVH